MNLHTFRFVDAVYRDDPNPQYQGNPFIEALPALPDDRTLTEALTHLPEFDAEERKMAVAYRIQRLGVLRQVMVALPRNVRLARGMIKMLHEGYGPRRPFSPSDNETVQSLYAMQQSGNFVSARQTDLAAQHSMSLIGASGSGKTFGLRHIAGLFPPVICHSKLGKWQLPFVFVEMSYDGESVHTLASSLFQEFDRLLPDGKYMESFIHRKSTLNAEQRLAKALTIAHELGVGLIIVDESQNQRSIGDVSIRRERKKAASTSPKVETPLTKLLITASNTSHIPMLFSGTLEMQSMMAHRFTRTRRLSGRGSAVWQPLRRQPEDGQAHSEFEILLRYLMRYQWVRNPIAFDAQWADVFYEHTQGIPDIIVKLYEATQEAALATGLETLTPELVARVFAKEFVPSAFGIRALRDSDEVMLDIMTDLYQRDPAQQDVEEAQLERAGPLFDTRATQQRKTAKTNPAKVPMPSPKPAVLSVDVIAHADVRMDGPGAGSLQAADLTNGVPVS